jgi:SpoVK/Ycf46/Vps4 family AAA+-type ATPase
VLLPTLGSRELAEITFGMVQKQGYILRRSDVSFDEMSLPMMEFIVRQTHDAAIIRERNAYLAHDMLERAISRKNDRLDESESLFSPVLTLTPLDFGVEMESEEQIAARRKAVDEEIGRQVGWSGDGSPKELFERIRRQIELVNQGGDASVMEVNWNMVITGNPGTGKTTLARLIYSFFRAYGVLSKDVFEERNGLELKGEYVGQTAPKVQAMFKVAMGGCLFLDEAYSLADGEGGSDVFAKEAVRTLLTEVENNRTSILVVLAGYKDKMSKLMRADPGLPRRFPNVVHLSDYTPAEIAEIALSKLQEKEPPMVCEEGLLEALAEHVAEKHAHEIPQHNAGLAVNLVEAALGSRAQRLHRLMDQGKLDGKDVNEVPVLKEDFGIGVKPGDVEEQEQIDAKVASMIGMVEAKQMFATIKRKVLYVDATGDYKVLQKCLNIVITGNPGTGKTTFARMMHRFMYAYGVLPKDNFVEKNGLELKGRYVGHTAPNVKAAVAEAMGGCLFLDEAYALVDQGGDSFSSEAIRTLLTEVENNRTALMVVLAGYKDKMGTLMRADPGLNRRFPLRLNLVDYTCEELAQICRLVAAERFGKTFEPGLLERLAKHIDEQYSGEIAQHNGGLAVNLTEAALDSLSERMVTVLEENPGMPKQELVELSKAIKAEDYGILERPQYVRDQEKAVIDAEMDAMIGMDGAKQMMQEFKTKVEYVEATRDVKVLQTCLNLVLTGSPGTGKTTLARLFARFMYAYGVLPRDTFVERNGLEMKGQYVGHTAPTVKTAVAEAMGGCLFLDEAYALAAADGDSFSGEAVRTLLTEVENNRTRLMVVLAGYKDKMGALMRADPGMPRRFPTSLHLDDYSPEQLSAICDKVATERFNKVFEPGLREALAKHIEEQHAARIPKENGGLAVNLTEAACALLAGRVVAHFGTTLHDEREKAIVLARVLTAADYGITDKSLGSEEAKRLAQTELDGMIGMGAGKVFFAEMRKKVEYVERTGDTKLLHTSLNMRITGNPGTGKTTLARLLFRYLHAYGVLPKDTFVEKNGLEMKGKYVGHTAPTVKEAIAEAMGGCLFLDEAYALADNGGDGFSGEAVRTLLTEVENNRTALMVVLAGYADKMANLMRADPGAMHCSAPVLLSSC